MSAYEDRLSTFEKTLKILQKRADSSIDELNRNVTMLLGIVSSQQMDIKEIKISLITVEERLDGMDQRLDKVDQRLDGMDQRLDKVDQRLDGMDQRLDKVDQRLDGMDQRLDKVDQRLDGMDQRLDGMGQRLDKVDQRLGNLETKFDEHTVLLTQILARLPEKAS